MINEKKRRGADFSAVELKQILSEDEAFQGLLETGEREQMEVFSNFLIETNKSLNLTALTKAEEVAYLHFWDSLSLLPLLEDLGFGKNQALLMIDVGSGAGFPGIPVKIKRPAWQFILMDSLAKRVRFLNEACARLKLQGIAAVHARAEAAGRMPEYREQADLVTARAVASLSVLAEYCLPLLKVGGYFIAMKAELDEELESATTIISQLGGEVAEVRRFVVPKNESKRSLVVIKKIRLTSSLYPRSNAQIKQNK